MGIRETSLHPHRCVVQSPRRKIMEMIQTQIPGCFEICPPVFKDERGTFIKTFHAEQFAAAGLETRFLEEYHTFSYQNVLRGLHFQRPPMALTKLVYCVWGEVVDAVVDLRKGSPAYGRFETFQLNAAKGNLVYIPPGVAHGFFVLSKSAVMVYKVSQVYSPEHDTGIRWNSVDIPWPASNPVISDRDAGLPLFAEFKNPFTFGEKNAGG